MPNPDDVKQCDECAFYDGELEKMKRGEVCMKGHRPTWRHPVDAGYDPRKWGYRRLCNDFQPND